MWVETVCHYLIKMNICVLYDPTVLLQGIYPGEILANEHQKMDKRMFIMTLHNSKEWKLSKCPSTEDWNENNYL